MNIRMYIIWEVGMDIQPRQGRVTLWSRKYTIHYWLTQLLLDRGSVVGEFGHEAIGVIVWESPCSTPLWAKQHFATSGIVSWRQSTVICSVLLQLQRKYHKNRIIASARDTCQSTVVHGGVPVLQLIRKYHQKIYIFQTFSYQTIYNWSFRILVGLLCMCNAPRCVLCWFYANIRKPRRLINFVGAWHNVGFAYKAVSLGLGLLTQFSPFIWFPRLLKLWKQELECYAQNSPVLPLHICGGTSQIWMWSWGLNFYYWSAKSLLSSPKIGPTIYGHHYANYI